MRSILLSNIERFVAPQETTANCQRKPKRKGSFRRNGRTYEFQCVTEKMDCKTSTSDTAFLTSVNGGPPESAGKMYSGTVAFGRRDPLHAKARNTAGFYLETAYGCCPFL